MRSGLSLRPMVIVGGQQSSIPWRIPMNLEDRIAVILRRHGDHCTRANAERLAAVLVVELGLRQEERDEWKSIRYVTDWMYADD